MADGTTEFELVSPEKLLLSRAVEMVVVPGSEGDFGVLARHAPFISTVRPGVIRVYENNEVKEEIFVAGGFAEVTPERCTVLADEAVPLGELDHAAIEQSLANAREDLEDAETDQARAAAERQIEVCQAKLQALSS